MNDLTIILISSLVLCAVMPISAFVLYLTLARHVALCESTPMDRAVVDAFDSEPERSAWHAGHQSTAAARQSQVLAAWHRTFLREAARIDPRAAEAFYRAAVGERETGEHAPELAAAVARVASRHDRRMALWRRQPSQQSGQPSAG